jgi:hypothetical protein
VFEQIAHQRVAVVALLSAALRSLDGSRGPPSLLPLAEAVASFEQEEAREAGMVFSAQPGRMSLEPFGLKQLGRGACMRASAERTCVS